MYAILETGMSIKAHPYLFTISYIGIRTIGGDVKHVRSFQWSKIYLYSHPAMLLTPPLSQPRTPLLSPPIQRWSWRSNEAWSFWLVIGNSVLTFSAALTNKYFRCFGLNVPAITPQWQAASMYLTASSLLDQRYRCHDTWQRFGLD